MEALESGRAAAKMKKQGDCVEHLLSMSAATGRVRQGSGSTTTGIRQWGEESILRPWKARTSLSLPHQVLEPTKRCRERGAAGVPSNMPSFLGWAAQWKDLRLLLPSLRPSRPGWNGNIVLALLLVTGLAVSAQTADQAWLRKPNRLVLFGKVVAPGASPIEQSAAQELSRSVSHPASVEGGISSTLDQRQKSRQLSELPRRFEKHTQPSPSQSI